MEPRRTVFITGGTGAIGNAITRAFQQSGHDVHFSYCSSDVEAEDLAALPGCHAYRLDFLTDWKVPAVDCDILINNAGVNLSGHSALLTEDQEIDDTFTVNLMAAQKMIQAYVPRMCEQGWGRVVNINSLYGLLSPANRLSYAMSKFSLRALTGSYASELAPHGVTVNDICPGPVDSAMLRSMGKAAIEDGRYGSLSDYLSDVGREVPTGRLVEPREVASAVMYLAGENAGSCTGLAMRVDGGIAAQIG